MSEKKLKLVFGAGGQDGSYCVEILLEQGHEVLAVIRDSSKPRIENLDIKNSRLRILKGDIADPVFLTTVFQQYAPDTVFNFAAQSHIEMGIRAPLNVFNTNSSSVLMMLELIKNNSNKIKFFQPSTAEILNLTNFKASNEYSFDARNIYGISKLTSFYLCRMYQEQFNLHISNGIFFNHESPRRPKSFVSRKISSGVANYIQSGGVLELGNLEAVRDWGHARDYVNAAILMTELPESKTLLIGSGNRFSVRDFVNCAFGKVGINVSWEGEGLQEKGFDKSNGKVCVKVNKDFFRNYNDTTPKMDFAEVRDVLNWSPKVNFPDLVEEMVSHDLQLNRKGA